MAIINYPATTNFGGMAAEAVGEVRSALSKLQRVKDAANAVAYGVDVAPTWSRLETNTDFSVAAGSGQAFYDGINGLVLALTTSDATGAFGKLDKGA